MEAAAEERGRGTGDGARPGHRRRSARPSASTAEARLRAGPVWREGYTDHQGLTRTGLVWTYEDASLIKPVTLYRRFVKLTAEAGLPLIRLHDVRHSYASAALASATGWHDVKIISQRLGHASVAITLDLYSHVLPAADEKLAHTLASVILGAE
jgi:integrase